MGYNIFQRRAAPDAGATEFAATVATLPPGLDDARAPDAQPAPDSAPAPDSVPSLDSVPSIPDVVTDFGGDSQPAPADSSVEQSPTLAYIGRYAIKGPLGSGGLGQVHEAWDPLLSRTVAVKTLQFDIDTPARVSLDGLFLNEARAAAGLSHPHIVTVFDAGLSAHGVYIAMERLRGRDLRHALAAGWQPTPGQSAQLVRRVADALAYAHARGVVHCDIKPANIFLGKRDNPKVLDFGIARVAHGASLPALDGLVQGSPHYLAPEQLQGGTVDARTDIHALGVVFYELLTLRKAFTGDSVEQITNAVLSFHPAPAHEVRPGVPPTLGAIAARAMARDPDQRYANATALATELRRWVDRHSAAETTQPATPRTERADPAVPPRRSGATRRTGTPASLLLRRRVGLLLGTLLLATGVSVVVAALGKRHRASAPDALRTPAPANATAGATVTAPATIADAAAPAAPAQATPTDAAVPAAAQVAPRTAPPPAAPARATRPAARPAAIHPRDARLALAPAVAAPAAGTVQFAISPWGQVEVDGNPVGTTPPLAQLALPEGAHAITVRNADFPPYSVNVQVQADKPLTVRHRFGQ